MEGYGAWIVDVDDKASRAVYWGEDVDGTRVDVDTLPDLTCTLDVYARRVRVSRRRCIHTEPRLRRPSECVW